MRILTIAHLLGLDELAIEGAWQGGWRFGIHQGAKVVGNRAIIAGRMLKGFHRQIKTAGITDTTIIGSHFIDNPLIVSGINHHRYRGVVFGGCT